MSDNSTQPNALIRESSPYLLQHAKNPVAWMPWGVEALERARQENKLIVVSIGYSSCHWCHVMERESFEDKDVANVMNARFISVKVDREERPDIDQIYMEAVQMMTRQGGWPLNCITTPLGKPVYGGTYFRKDDWINLLNQLADLWETDPKRVLEYGDKLTEGLGMTGALPLLEKSPVFSLQTIQNTLNNWKGRWDLRFGGPAKAPKFPLPCNYQFLLRAAALSGNSDLTEHVSLTLETMAKGGIFDHVGGGFFRYSTDQYWKVPHFEKMLYDNGQLLGLYADAARILDKGEYLNVAASIAQWLKCEMKAPQGGYYSAIDADSEGIEGQFYIWTQAELEAEELWDEFEKHFYTDERGLWEGRLVTYRTNHRSDGKDFEELCQRMLEIRQSRTRPMRDEKCICSWNALTATGFFKAFRATQNPDYLKDGREILNFISSELYDAESGLLSHHWINGKKSTNGFLEDYAFTLEALTTHYECSFDESSLLFAKELLFHCLDRFYDPEKGVFLVSSHGQTDIISRPVEFSDNVIPSTNAVMAHQLVKLGTYFGESQWMEIATRLLNAVTPDMTEYGEGYGHWADLYLKLYVGNPELTATGPNSPKIHQDARVNKFPYLQLAAAKTESNLPVFSGRWENDHTLFYLCRNQTCLQPVNNLKEVGQSLVELRIEL